MSGSPAASGVFYDLLRKVQEEHERQTAQLQEQVARLQNQLTTLACTGIGYTSTNSGCGPPISEKKGEVLELKGTWKQLMLRHCPTPLTRVDLHMHPDASLHSLRSAVGSQDSQEEEIMTKVQSQIQPPCFLRLLQNGAISPNSTWRLYWEVVGLGLVCFDMINIPLQVFNPPMSIFTQIMDWATLIFWSADVAQAFFVGYYYRGECVMKQPAIFLHYLRTWFLLDATVVVPDWFLTITGTSTQAGDLSRLLKSARAIRVLRLLRVMKLQRVLNMLYDMIDNEHSFIIAELIKMMAVILVLNHVIACGWFMTGKVSQDFHYENTWLDWGEPFLNSDIGYQYTTSLHWTLTQFTPASMDVVARNLLERLYSIIVLLFAMVAFSSIVGTVTSSMTVIRQMKNDKQKQFWMLRRYLKQKSITFDLSLRMTRFLEHQVQKQQRLIQAGKISLLSHLSDQLARELAFEMYEPCLSQHSFFRHLSMVMKGVAARICQMALKAQQVAQNDIVFSAGEDAARAFIIKAGVLHYEHYTIGMQTPPLNEWLAEATIWTAWCYRGQFWASKPSELLSVEASRFAEAMSIHPKPISLARRYGQKVVRLLNGQHPEERTDLLRNTVFFERLQTRQMRPHSTDSKTEAEAEAEARTSDDCDDEDADDDEEVEEVDGEDKADVVKADKQNSNKAEALTAAADEVASEAKVHQAKAQEAKVHKGRTYEVRALETTPEAKDLEGRTVEGQESDAKAQGPQLAPPSSAALLKADADPDEFQVNDEERSLQCPRRIEDPRLQKEAKSFFAPSRGSCFTGVCFHSCDKQGGTDPKQLLEVSR